MKEKYIVKPIVNVTSVLYERTYGVYENYVVDTDGRHCDNSDFRLNLVCECKNEWVANQICSLLNTDDYIEEL